MSGDFFEPDRDERDRRERDRRGLAAWLEDSGLGGGALDGGADRQDVPEQRSGPAYVVSFGWLPARLPPAPVWSVPLPRRAPDDTR
ncbi:hypothetical protein [Saccharothrix sp. HUAS TT1]|uniref:hypothetical protein n=1 Tax=unclassified Saccharothrix TaxID=2593673 RepID=UPI00345B759D